MGIFDIFSGSAGKQAGADQIAGIQKGKDEATAAFGQGRDALTTDYAKGLQEWDPVTKTANQGESAYADAMGLNGPEGSARAQAAFRTDPSYQFKLTQGLAAAKAQAAKNGTSMSGGQLIDLNNYAQGTADQGWNNYIRRLCSRSSGRPPRQPARAPGSTPASATRSTPATPTRASWTMAPTPRSARPRRARTWPTTTPRATCGAPGSRSPVTPPRPSVAAASAR